MRSFASGWIRRLTSERALFSAANLAQTAAAMVGSLVCARLLEPAVLGIFQSFLLYYTYASIGSQPIIQGFSREYPPLLGAGQPEAALRMARVAHTAMRWIATFAAIGILVPYFVWSSPDHRPAAAWAALSVGLLVFFDFLAAIPNCALTGRQQFGRLARIRLLLAAAGLVLLAAVWAAGAAGMATRMALSAVALWWLLRANCRELLPRLADRRVIGQLIRVGAPLCVASYLHGLILVADRTVLAARLGPEAVGLYALTALVITTVQAFQIPQVTIYYTEAALASARPDAFNALRKILRKYLLRSAGLSLLACAFLYAVMPAAVERLLPAYVDGIPAARIACLTGLVGSVWGSAFVLVVLRRNALNIAVMALTLAIYHALLWGLPDSRFSILTASWIRLGVVTLGAAVFLALHAILLRKENPRAAE